MPTLRKTLILFLTASLFSCAPPPEVARPTAEEDLTAIAEVRDKLLQAYFDNDVSGIFSVLTGDHLTMAPNTSAMPNDDALMRWHQDRIDVFSAEADHTVEEVVLDGDLAVERWSSIVRLTPHEGGEVVEDVLKGIWVWQRQAEGVWLILWSSFSSDLPFATDGDMGGGA